ncbi:MAG: glycosyltransferase family 4 protein, partial [Ilumatobacteraceae bacterium]
YRLAGAVTVLSEDLRDNVAAKLPPSMAGKVRVIPNFVDTEVVVPGDRRTELRAELGLGDGVVVLYAGNVGFSQSLELLLAAAGDLSDLTFLIVGDGVAKPSMVAASRNLDNVVFQGYLPGDRLAELLATGDLHVVPLKAGLGRVSVPSKTYSIMAAGRPVVASIDPGTAVPRILAEASAGVSVPPDDAGALTAALRALGADPDHAREMGERGRAWVVREASPHAVGVAYDQLISEMSSRA